MMRGWAGLLVVLIAAAAPCEARYLEYEASRLGWTVTGETPSVRLRALGGLRYAIEDENAELNLSDFGRNLAGVARDRSGWTIDSWVGQSRNWNDENTSYRGTPVRQRARYDDETGGVEVVYRRDGLRAIGVTAGWQGLSSEMRFGEDTRVRGPSYGAFVNEKLGPIATAVGLRRATDEERLVSPNTFAVSHHSELSVLSLAAAYDLPFGGGMTLGAAADFERTRIEGESQDPSGFHNDLYHWRRPATHLRFCLVRPDGTGDLSFGALCTIVNREGTEEAAINWSDRFPQNPGGNNYVARVPIFVEEEDLVALEGRAAWTLARWIRLSGVAGMRREEVRIEETPDGNFSGSRTGGSFDESAWFGGAGLGVTSASRRVRVGIEAETGGATRKEVRARARTEVDRRSYELRAGLEYHLPNRLVLRGGYQRGSVDRDIDLPASLFLANGGTFGFGYVPGGGTISLDGSVRLWREDPKDDGTAANAVAESGDILLGLRVLF